MDSTALQKKEGICSKIMKHPYVFVILLFFVSFIIRGILYSFTKRIRIYNDELLYYGIARSLFHGEGLVVRGQAVTFQKILYSLILAPTFAVESSVAQMKIIGWINAGILSLSVFPSFGIARKLLKKDVHIVCAMVLWFVSSWMVTGVTFMCETLSALLYLTFMYGVVSVLQLRDRKKRIFFNAVLAVVLYLAYVNKEIALFLLIGYIVMLVYQLITDKEERIGNLLCLITFAGCFLVCHLLVKNIAFTGMANSYGMGFSQGELQEQAQNMDLDRIWKTCYYILYNSIFTILAFGVFPITLPAVLLPKMEKKERAFTIMLLSSLFMAMGAISFVSSSIENQVAYNSRVHTRYVECLIFVGMVLLFVIFEKYQEEIKQLWKTVLVVHILYLALFVAMGYTFLHGSNVDQSALFIYGKIAQQLDAWSVKLLGGNLFSLFLRIGVMAIFAVLLYLLHKSKKFITVFTVMVLVVNLGNFMVSYRAIYKSYHTDPQKIQAYEEAEKYLQELNGNILFVENSKESIQSYFDSFVDRQIYVDTLRTLVLFGLFDDKKLDFATERLPRERPYAGGYWDVTEIDYILTYGEVRMENAEKVDGFPLESQGVILYKNREPERICIDCSIFDVLSDEETEDLVTVTLE